MLWKVKSTKSSASVANTAVFFIGIHWGLSLSSKRFKKAMKKLMSAVVEGSVKVKVKCERDANLNDLHLVFEIHN